jgi:hypothetical protein
LKLNPSSFSSFNGEGVTTDRQWNLGVPSALNKLYLRLIGDEIFWLKGIGDRAFMQKLENGDW